MEWLTSPETWISLVTLTLLEIVLGIDNIIFITILAGKLPEGQRDKARRVGLSLALITRILLLCGIWLMSRLTRPLFSVSPFGYEFAFSGRDLILLSGGLFLIGKSVHEIHDKLEREDGAVTTRLAPTFASVIVQIVLLDIVFSLDSVITAVGMARQIGVMVAAVVLAMGFMLAFSGHLSRFMDRHPTLKMLAMSFLLLVGFVLVAEGFHREIPKGYIYFAMAFAFGVEMLNLKVRARPRAEAVPLRQPYR